MKVCTTAGRAARDDLHFLVFKKSGRKDNSKSRPPKPVSHPPLRHTCLSLNLMTQFNGVNNENGYVLLTSNIWLNFGSLNFDVYLDSFSRKIFNKSSNLSCDIRK